MVDTTHVPAIGYMEIVDNRDAATLYPIVQAHTRPGTIVWSDQWAAYNRLSSAVTNITGHQTVNHSRYFKDPTIGVHTNTIESYWSRYSYTVAIHVQLCPMILLMHVHLQISTQHNTLHAI